MSGSSPTPTGGKPVAPVDAAWELTVDANAFHGVLTLTPRSGPGQLAVEVTAAGGAECDAPTSFALPGARGVPLSCPLSGRLRSGSAATLTVVVRLTTTDTRGRVFTIPLMAEPAATAAPTTGASATGVRTVTDDRGETTILQPATNPRF